MEDTEFLARFEACSLSSKDFHHREHVRVVWLYLCRYPLLETLVRFSDGLKRFAAAHGKPNLYHETITWSYVFLIHERKERSRPDQTWQEFVEANADLFDWKDNILKSYYQDETLSSERARKIFVFPDKNYNSSPTRRKRSAKRGSERRLSHLGSTLSQATPNDRSP